MNKDSNNIVLLRKCLQKHKTLSSLSIRGVFPEIYSLIDKRGIDLKSEFLLTFKTWKDKKNQRSVASNAVVETSSVENNKENKIAPANFVQAYDLDSVEKKKVIKRKVLGEKNSTTVGEESTKRSRKPQTSEKELWEHLDTLNKKFAVAKEHKKKNKTKKTLIV